VVDFLDHERGQTVGTHLASENPKGGGGSSARRDKKFGAGAGLVGAKG